MDQLSKRRRKFVMIGGGVLAVAVITTTVAGGLAAVSGSSRTAAARLPAAAPTGPVRGSGVTVTEYGELTCTDCAAYDAVLKKHRVKVEWRDDPVSGRRATAAAVVGRAAGRQGMFWQFHDQMAGHPFPARLDNTRFALYLLALAKRAGCNLTTLEKDMSDPALLHGVQADMAYARQQRVTRAPAFVVDGDLVSTPQDLERAITR